MLRYNQLSVTLLRLVGALVLCLLLVPHAHSRTWSDKSGKQKVEADFLGYAEGKVELKKSNGKTVKVPLAKLCKEDQRYVRELVKKQRSRDEELSKPAQETAGEMGVLQYQRGGGFPDNALKGPQADRLQELFRKQLAQSRQERLNQLRDWKDPGPTDDKELEKLITWTDVTGKYKVEASFIEITGPLLRLRRKDGKVIAIPKDKLSKESNDQAQLLSLRSGMRKNGTLDRLDPNNPFGDRSVDTAATTLSNLRSKGVFFPGDIVEVKEFRETKQGEVLATGDRALKVMFEGESHPETVRLSFAKVRLVKANPNAKPKGKHAMKVSRPNRSAAKHTHLGKKFDGNFDPDPAQTAVAQKSEAVSLGPDKQFGSVKSLAISDNGRWAFLTYEAGQGFDFKELELQVIDLEQGVIETSFTTEFTDGFIAPALSPSGSRLAAGIPGEHKMRAQVIGIFDIDSERLESVASWLPSNDENDDIDRILWIDDNRVLTSNRDGFVVWDASTAKALYTVAAASLGTITLSPGTNQIAIADRSGLYILDSATGKPLQKVAVPPQRWYDALAFDPSGKLIAGVAKFGGALDLFNLETGTLFATLQLNGASGSLVWTDDEHVLIGNKHLVHVPSKANVWTYNNKSRKFASAGQTSWYFFEDSHGRILVPVQFPHPEVRSMSDAELAILPGDPVAIEFEFIQTLTASESNVTDQTREVLTKTITDAGYVVADNADAVIVAKYEPGKRRDYTFHFLGFRYGIGGIKKTYKITERIYKLDLQVNGQTVWTRKRVQNSPNIRNTMPEDLSQELVDQHMVPKAFYFGDPLPTRFIKPEAIAARVSEITAAGIQ